MLCTSHIKFGYIFSTLILAQIINLEPSHFTKATTASILTESVSTFCIVLLVISSAIHIMGLLVNNQPLLINDSTVSRKSNTIETFDTCIKILLAINVSVASSVFDNKSFIGALILILVVFKGLYLQFSLPYYSIE